MPIAPTVGQKWTRRKKMRLIDADALADRLDNLAYMDGGNEP